MRLDRKDTTTIVSMWCARVAASGNERAMMVRRGGQFEPVTWNELARDVRRTAAALVGLGVARGDRVAQISRNRYEWIVTDLAILLAGGVHVPVHASLAGPQVAYQIINSGSKIVIVSGPDQAEKLVDQAARFPDDLKIFSYEECPEPVGPFKVERLAKLVDAVDDRVAQKLQDEAPAKAKPEDLATILYTSGTTGDPKGVMLSHTNVMSNTNDMVEIVTDTGDDLRLTWLPLSHIFARTCDLYTWIAGGIVLALADSPEAVIGNAQELHPTLINGVPYFFDKLMRFLESQGLADKPGVLKQALGGRPRICCSGGAALPDHVHHFFVNQGVFLFQGYGLTETAPTITTCREGEIRIGTVGRALPTVEVHIAEDGEILTRGPHVMMGYWNMPKATAEVIRDGWFHTGDIGELDDEGYLRITGRKKEMIVTAGGKNVSPVNVEALLTSDPLVAQAFVIGDGRNFISALIVPEPEALKAAIIKNEIPVTSPEQALKHPQVYELYANRIAERLASVSHYEQVQRFALIGRPFTPESGELTLTLKLRRNVIEKNHRDTIEAMYAKPVEVRAAVQ